MQSLLLWVCRCIISTLWLNTGKQWVLFLQDHHCLDCEQSLFLLLKLYLFTFTINKLQIQTSCKIAELIKAGSIETYLLPNIQYYSNDIKIYNNYKISSDLVRGVQARAKPWDARNEGSRTRAFKHTCGHLCVSCICSTDQEKRETAYNLLIVPQKRSQQEHDHGSLLSVR